MKRMISLLIIIIMLLSSSCLSPVSIDAYGYVITVGVDKGRDKRFYYTFALQRELAEQNTESEGGAIILCCEGDSVFDAVNELEGNVPYTLNFSRVSFLVFGSETAKAGDIRDFVSTSFDSLRIRTSAVVIVSEGDAFEFVGGMYANNEANITKLQSALMTDKEKTGTVTAMSVSRLIEACSDGRFDYVAALGSYDEDILTDMSQKKSESEGENPLKDVEAGDRVGGLKSLITGAALFSGYSMTGSLTRDDIMFLNMAVGEFKNGSLTLKYNNSFITVLLTLIKSKRSITINKDGVEAHAEIALSASVRLKDAGIKAGDADAFLTEYLPGYIQERLTEVFIKCRDADSDAMRFGQDAVKHFGSVSDWEEFCWKDRYRSLTPEFKVTVRTTDKYINEDMQ